MLVTTVFEGGSMLCAWGGGAGWGMVTAVRLIAFAGSARRGSLNRKLLVAAVEAARAAAMYERRPEFVSLMRPEPIKKASRGRWKGVERQGRGGLGALEGPWTGAAWLSPACTPPLVSGTRALPSSSPPPGGLVACLHAPS